MPVTPPPSSPDTPDLPGGVPGDSGAPPQDPAGVVDALEQRIAAERGRPPAPDPVGPGEVQPPVEPDDRAPA